MQESFWTHLQDKSVDVLMTMGTRVIYAAIVLIIGLILIRLIMRLIRKIMDKSKTELSLRTFIESLSIALLYAILIFVIGLTVGIKATAFMTIFGAAGIAIGLALQGSLANFAGGLLILVFKPFKIGDEVIVNGIEGEVKDINILYTRIHDWRGEVYTLPNGNVANSAVRNNSAEELRRVQIELHFSFDEDFDRLREIITTEMKKHPDVIQEKPFQLWISNFQDYYIKTSARCWCKNVEYWGVYWDIEEKLKKVLEKNNIKLAIPKQDIYLPEGPRGGGKQQHTIENKE